MAKHAIFNQSGYFLHLAESDSEKNSLIAHSYPTYSTKEISDQLFTESFITSNPTHPDLSIWQDYLSKLENIDLDSISFPLSSDSFQQWFNSQPGYPTKNIFQLP